MSVALDSDARAQTLPGLDAAFLYAESGNVAMHTLKLALLEPGSATRLDWTRLRRRVQVSAARLPPLRRRLIMVPLQLHHPRWIEVDQLEVDAHLERLELPPGSGFAALEQTLAEFAARPLARHRPLWQLLIITGLPDDRLAVALKLHHALADGLAFAQLLEQISSDAPGPWRAPPDRGEHLSAAPPSRATLLVRALARRLGDLARLPMLTIHSLIRALRVGRLRRRARRAPPRLFRGPRAFFNHQLGPARAFRHLSLPLASLKAIKRHFGVRFNDVVLALVAGAFARMRERGELSGAPLIAAMPIALPSTGESEAQGNRLGNTFTSLCDTIADPAERLLAISETAATAKAMAHCRGLDQLRRWAEYDAPWSQRFLWRLARASPSPPINLIVSSVAGPRVHRYLGRERIDQLWSVGPLVERAGLNVTAWTYAGQVSISLLADAGQWTTEQLDRLVADIEAAAAELFACAPLEPDAPLDLVS